MTLRRPKGSREDALVLGRRQPLEPQGWFANFGGDALGQTNPGTPRGNGIRLPTWRLESSCLALSYQGEYHSVKGRKMDSGDHRRADRLAIVAACLNVDADLVKSCFDDDNGTLRINVEASTFGATVSDRVRSIGLLLVAGRQIGGFDQGPTNVSAIREECRRHGILDTNFASNMRKLDRFLIAEKTGRSSGYTLRSCAPEAVRRLLATIVVPYVTYRIGFVVADGNREGEGPM